MERDGSLGRNLAKYPLCSTSLVVDGRLAILFNGVLSYLLYQHPDQPAAFYQQRVDRFVSMFRQGDWSSYPSLLN